VVLIPRRSTRAVLIPHGRFFYFDFRRKFAFIFEILLGLESGPQGV